MRRIEVGDWIIAGVDGEVDLHLMYGWSDEFSPGIPTCNQTEFGLITVERE